MARPPRVAWTRAASILACAGSAPTTAAPSRAIGSLRMPPPQPISRNRNPARLSSRLGSRPNRRQAASLMKPIRTGLSLCSMPIWPAGSHQVSASAAKRATSAASIVEPCVSIGPNSQGPAVAAAKSHRYVYSPFRAGACPTARQRLSRMARLVMKFGGTSVADIDRIRNVARHVKREVDAGHDVAVVVSAMSGTTNELVAWCRGAAALHDAREYDAVVSAGEQVTAGLLAITLEGMGVNAGSWQG